MRILDWGVVATLIVVSIVAGLLLARRSSRQGAEGYFTGNRNLPWWAIAVSNTSTYQSGNGAFVMLLVAFGLAGNWLWWAAWIIWMPLVAIIWAPMWRRMRITTTGRTHHLAIRRPTRPMGSQGLRRDVLLWFLGSADRLHHRFLRSDDRAAWSR